MQAIKSTDRFLNVEQVADRLNCSRRHIYNMINYGKIKAFKIGGRNGFRIRESVLEEFIRDREEAEGL